MSKQASVKIMARWFTIHNVRWVINDAINKGLKVTYQEEGGFIETIFTLRGDIKDVTRLYNHIVNRGRV